MTFAMGGVPHAGPQQSWLSFLGTYVHIVHPVWKGHSLCPCLFSLPPLSLLLGLH